MKLTKEVKAGFVETYKSLSGYSRRIFMACIVKSLGKGGQSIAHKELGWNCGTIRKGTNELDTGIECLDGRTLSGRKSAEEHLPNLLQDITSIVDSQSQTDPTFQTTRLYTRLSVKVIRKQLIDKFNYSDEELPCCETLRGKVNALGYRPVRVAKSKPQKKFPKRTPSLSKCTV